MFAHYVCIQVTPERYMEVIRAMQPDMFVALADEVGGSRGSGRFRARVPKP